MDIDDNEGTGVLIGTGALVGTGPSKVKAPSRDTDGKEGGDVHVLIGTGALVVDVHVLIGGVVSVESMKSPSLPSLVGCRS